jgi:hypothetical protein
MRKIPIGTPPQLNRPIDFETLEKVARRQAQGKQTGSDGHPREFSKFGPTAYLSLYWAAYNAYLSGAKPSVGAHEWIGTIASPLPKKRGSLKVGDFRGIACICTKLSLFLKIMDMRLDRITEDYGLIDDAQEGFRRCRNTMRQLSKLYSLLAEQRRRGVISAQLFLDLVNAFNSPNHSSIFFILRAKGFHEADIALFSQLYKGSFLVMVNTFGSSAACFLMRGFHQGAQPSPRAFNLLVDPLHAILRWCQRGCTVLSVLPTGTSGFADDTNLHADGPDAIPALAIMVQLTGDYVAWAGMKINMEKSAIRAVDMSTGRPVPTDSVQLNGVSFPVILPDQPYKHLGVRGTMLGDFTAEKQHVLGDMATKLKALQED